MTLRMSAAIVIGCLCLPAFADGPADRILVNGRVLTVDATDRVAEAIAIRDGLILAAGTTAAIERLAGLATDAVWDSDFYAAEPSSIKDATCLMAIFDGNVIHRSERFP